MCDRTGQDRFVIATAMSARISRTRAAAPIAIHRNPVSARLPLPARLIGWDDIYEEACTLSS